jgi:hypothetical protein
LAIKDAHQTQLIIKLQKLNEWWTQYKAYNNAGIWEIHVTIWAERSGHDCPKIWHRFIYLRTLDPCLPLFVGRLKPLLWPPTSFMNFGVSSHLSCFRRIKHLFISFPQIPQKCPQYHPSSPSVHSNSSCMPIEHETIDEVDFTETTIQSPTFGPDSHTCITYPWTYYVLLKNVMLMIIYNVGNRMSGPGLPEGPSYKNWLEETPSHFENHSRKQQSTISRFWRWASIISMSLMLISKHFGRKNTEEVSAFMMAHFFRPRSAIHSCYWAFGHSKISLSALSI